MKVRLINDDWSSVPKDRTIHLVIKVGDPLPIKGEEYEVVGHAYVNGNHYYELADLDYSNYPGGRLFFGAHRFEVSDDAFIPNTVIDGMPARVEQCFMSFTLPNAKIFKEKLPRKKKKQIKKYGMRWVRNTKINDVKLL